MDTRKQILNKYNVAPDAQIGSGMEAEVFEYKHDSVLKIYAGTATFDSLLSLKQFYDSLERQQVYFKFPHIDSVYQERDCVVTIEQKLGGHPMSALLTHLDDKQLDAAMQEYLRALLALANINAPKHLTQLKLFDPEQLSKFPHGDWYQFLQNYLKEKHPQIALHLGRDVIHFSEKFEQLNEQLESPYAGQYKLIHGDFCPGNLLFDNQHQAVALIDFGLMTMYGDHLFDLATGWVFFDMYDELKANIRERFLEMLLEAIGHDKRGDLYRYVLIYSILSANTYSPDCTDGHYQWCVSNLNNSDFWKHLA